MVISSLVFAMFSSVAFVRIKKFTICRYDVSIVVFSVKDTLVLALCFDASSVHSAEETDFFMKKWESYIATPSCFPLVSHANLKLLRNPIIKVESKMSKVYGFICAFIRFNILLMCL